MEFIVLWLFCGVITAAIASSKNLSPAFWFGVGCLFGFFAPIAVLFVKSNKASGQDS